jgi:hypothetical protein
MQEIKLDYSKVMQQLDEVNNALDDLSLPALSKDQLGQNQLEFTNVWIQREENLHTMVKNYIEAVKKNIKDTRASVDILKKQDEAIGK